MTAEIVAFLRARYSETEARALAAHPGPWEWSDRGWQGRLTADAPDFHRILTVDEQGAEASAFDFMHIAEHDPASVLRDVAAKRAILDLCVPQVEVPGIGIATAQLTPENEALRDALLRHLATEYSDHPEYQEAWRP